MGTVELITFRRVVKHLKKALGRGHVLAVAQENDVYKLALLFLKLAKLFVISYIFLKKLSNC